MPKSKPAIELADGDCLGGGFGFVGFHGLLAPWSATTAAASEPLWTGTAFVMGAGCSLAPMKGLRSLLRETAIATGGIIGAPELEPGGISPTFGSVGSRAWLFAGGSSSFIRLESLFAITIGATLGSSLKEEAEEAPASCFLRFLRRRQKKSRPKSKSKPKMPTPTAIPTMAPVLRPPSLLFCVTAAAPAVLDAPAPAAVPASEVREGACEGGADVTAPAPPPLGWFDASLVCGAGVVTRTVSRTDTVTGCCELAGDELAAEMAADTRELCASTDVGSAFGLEDAGAVGAGYDESGVYIHETLMASINLDDHR